MRQVLIAHQSTIPHYRVPFYNALEELRPSTWTFDVAFDTAEIERKKFFEEPLNPEHFRFSILPTRTLSVRAGTKTITYQTFWRQAANYDLIVVESAVNNLTYPLCHLHQLWGKKIAYWGHDKDRSKERVSRLKSAIEGLKLELIRQANGFFAYTEGVKHALEVRGVSSQRIYVLNNTIDVNEQRQAFAKFSLQRDVLRQRLGVQDRKVLLFVGRFTTSKRVDFLLEVMTLLCDKHPDIHLFLVGSGGEQYLESAGLDDVRDHISYFGPMVDLEKLAPIYTASDIFAFPGAVGLGPLQALCYDLPVVTIDSPTHMPEIEYLSPQNSVVLPESTTVELYARELADLLENRSRLMTLRAATWPSIRHLTIENMATNFIAGVDTLLGS